MKSPEDALKIFIEDATVLRAAYKLAMERASSVKARDLYHSGQQVLEAALLPATQFANTRGLQDDNFSAVANDIGVIGSEVIATLDTYTDGVLRSLDDFIEVITVKAPEYEWANAAYKNIEVHKFDLADTLDLFAQGEAGHSRLYDLTEPGTVIANPVDNVMETGMADDRSIVEQTFRDSDVTEKVTTEGYDFIDTTNNQPVFDMRGKDAKLDTLAYSTGNKD